MALVAVGLAAGYTVIIGALAGYQQDRIDDRIGPLARTFADGGVLTVGDLRLDSGAHHVRRADRTDTLSPTEFRLLRHLMENPDRVLSKTQILDHVWRYDFGGDTSIVESYVSYLRRKMDTTDPRLIHTIRGVGHVLRRPL